MEGEGLPVVLIHGVGLDHTMWDLVVARLSTELRVLRYDIVGHGQTPALAERLTFVDLSRQLTDVLGSHGVNRIAVVGFSLGALIAQDFTLAHPERVASFIAMVALFDDFFPLPHRLHVHESQESFELLVT